MSEEPAKENPEEGAEPKKSSKLPIIIGGVVGLLVIVGVVIFFTPIGKKLTGGGEEHTKKKEKVEEAKEAKEAKKPEEIAFIKVPGIVVNLRSDTKQKHVLKIEIAVEINEAKDKEAVENLRPRIVDQMQSFLRELEYEDVNAVGAFENIRQELYPRVCSAVAPIKINSILINEFIPY